MGYQNITTKETSQSTMSVPSSQPSNNINTSQPILTSQLVIVPVGGNNDNTYLQYQLRHRKQKPGEMIEEYAVAIGELWKQAKMDRVAEFIEKLQSEFILPVQTAMLTTVDQAIEKARAVESAYSIRIKLSAYSLMPNYMQLLQGEMGYKRLW
ncbi:13084_t:CDS:2 [Funneliformis caledonium]|uniref:13084_t:CDS:1 n=1 Tax=Funneliformis caledonium TaxID=1117310 RepID=A0A9N8YQL5_9GLOM|nr:13084_t:CDS:2 [Funneliformis caledonium]